MSYVLLLQQTLKRQISQKFRNLRQNLRQYCKRIQAGSGRAGYSITYGINRASILMKAHHFDVTKSLPYDIMHTIFEGVAPHHLKLLFENTINNSGYLTLQ